MQVVPALETSQKQASCWQNELWSDKVVAALVFYLVEEV